jgi:hypothetical protein
VGEHGDLAAAECELFGGGEMRCGLTADVRGRSTVFLDPLFRIAAPQGRNRHTRIGCIFAQIFEVLRAR